MDGQTSETGFIRWTLSKSRPKNQKSSFITILSDSKMTKTITNTMRHVFIELTGKNQKPDGQLEDRMQNC